MPVFLDQIVASTRAKVAAAKLTADRGALELQAEKHVPRGFRKSLTAKGTGGVAVISELKKSSPSKGLIRADFRPEYLAKQLASAGAAALSVLTNEEYFQGSLQYLRNASAAVAIPCLRKDFVVDEFQVLEARANSADAILLIVAALSQAELIDLAHKAAERKLDVLCEVHDAQELQRALDAGCDLIGVNSRDLRTFHVDPETPVRLAEQIPGSAIRVAESGIRTGEDIARLRSAGYQAFLIGESLMRAQHPGKALEELIANAMASSNAAAPMER